MKSIMASIILPTYNRSKFLDCAIGSVLGQTFQNWYLIVVEDASTDDISKISKSSRRL